jgi:hypothetical protein
MHALRLAQVLRASMAVMLAVAGGAAAAGPDEDYALAQQQFDRRVAEARLEHRMPRLADPSFRQIIKTLSDRQRFLESRTFAPADLDALMVMCNGSNRSMMAYAFSGLGDVSPRTVLDPVKRAEMGPAAARNAATFQDEMTLLLAFNMQCTGKALPLINAMVATFKPELLNAQQRNGIAAMRAGALKMLIGGAGSVTDAAMSKENKRKIVTAASINAPIFAESVEPSSRKQAHDYLESIAGRVPPKFLVPFRHIIVATTRQDCNALCAAPGGGK